MFRLDKKVALITGAASGIGAAIAAAFAQSGARVYLADRDREGADRQANLIRQSGGDAHGLTLDVTREADCTAGARRIQEETEGLDILVNNAGVGAVGTLLQSSGADLDRLYAVNVRGVFNVSKACLLRRWSSRQRGCVINLASVGGLVGIRDRLAYCTTKFAVVGLTKSMALDHAEARIRVNCLCPGRVETPFVQSRLKEYPDPAKAYREMSSTQLFERMIRPEEIAAAAVYLASDESYMITGTAMAIDCGWTAGK